MTHCCGLEGLLIRPTQLWPMHDTAEGTWRCSSEAFWIIKLAILSSSKPKYLRLLGQFQKIAVSLCPFLCLDPTNSVCHALLVNLSTNKLTLLQDIYELLLTCTMPSTA